jgi:dienelactone hydrolase
MGIKIRPFKIKSSGVRLCGYSLVPKDADGKLPAVIVSHGFGSNMLISYSYARVFVDMGYAAFCYDFPNSGSSIFSGGSGTRMSVIDNKEDLKNVLEYVRSLDFIDTDRIILAGCSQGGMVTALTAPEVEDRIERIVLYYPALCIPDDARAGNVIGTKIDPDNIPDTFRAIVFKVGKKYPLDSMTLDPYREICGFKKPVFIVHGKEDKIVNIDYSRRAAELYPDCRLVEVHGDHGFILRGGRASKKATRKYLSEI